MQKDQGKHRKAKKSKKSANKINSQKNQNTYWIIKRWDNINQAQNIENTPIENIEELYVSNTPVINIENNGKGPLIICCRSSGCVTLYKER